MTLGFALSATGMGVTIIASALGWMLVQTYRADVHLTPSTEQDEVSVQQAPALTIVRHG